MWVKRHMRVRRQLNTESACRRHANRCSLLFAQPCQVYAIVRGRPGVGRGPGGPPYRCGFLAVKLLGLCQRLGHAYAELDFRGLVQDNA